MWITIPDTSPMQWALSPDMQWALPVAEMQRAQLLMVAGFVMLGWVLARRQLGLRKRVNRDARAANKALKAIREQTEPAVPLCDAPVETQRWQVAMFDLQRELKAELDTRITVVHALMRQLDDRIERLAHLENGGPTMLPAQASPKRLPPPQVQTIRQLVQSGHTSKEIANQTGIPLGEVELIVGTIAVDQGDG